MTENQKAKTKQVKAVKESRKKKVKVGWFTFTCCEGCAIVFIELLNDNFKEWVEKIDFKYFKFLKSKNELRDLDLAIVEGAISTKKELELLREIRNNSKYIMTVGSCALTGMPAGLRNNFTEEQKKEITEVLKKFDYLERVEPVSKFVKVDFSIPGCPMDENQFLREFSSFIDSYSTRIKKNKKD